MSEVPTVNVSQDPTIFVNSEQGQVAYPLSFIDNNVHTILVGKALTPEPPAEQHLKISALSLPTYLNNRGPQFISKNKTLAVVSEDHITVTENIDDTRSHVMTGVYTFTAEMKQLNSILDRQWSTIDLWRMVKRMRKYIVDSEAWLAALSKLNVQVNGNSSNEFDIRGNNKANATLQVKSNIPMSMTFKFKPILGIDKSITVAADAELEQTSSLRVSFDDIEFKEAIRVFIEEYQFIVAEQLAEICSVVFE